MRRDNAARTVWFATCALTVVADMTLAVEVGMSLAALLYIYRISQTTTVSLVTQEDVEDGRLYILQNKPLPEYVSIIRIHGPFLFGTTDKLLEQTDDVSVYAPIVILRFWNMTAIDATGLHALEIVRARLVRSGRALLLCGARDQPQLFIGRASFVAKIGAVNSLPNVTAALARAAVIHSGFDGLGNAIARQDLTL